MKNILLSALPLLFWTGSSLAQFDIEASNQVIPDTSSGQPPISQSTFSQPPSSQPIGEPALIGTERPEIIDETLILRGQITSFDFTQPETRILIDAQLEQWELVAPSAVELRRLGWTSSSLFPGELVEVEVVRQLGIQKTANLKRLTRANGALLITSLNRPEPKGFEYISGGMYSLDTDHTNLEFIYNHMGFSDVSVRFERINADVLWNAESPEASIIQLNIDVSSLRSGSTKLDEELRGPGFFDSLNYPRIEFRSTQVRLLKWGNLQVDGQLNIKGLSRPVRVEARLNKSGINPLTQNTTVGIKFKSDVARSEWGLSAYSPLIEDQIDVSFQGEFILRAADIPSVAPSNIEGRAPLSSSYSETPYPQPTTFLPRTTTPDKASDNVLQLNE